MMASIQHASWHLVTNGSTIVACFGPPQLLRFPMDDADMFAAYCSVHLCLYPAPDRYYSFNNPIMGFLTNLQLFENSGCYNVSHLQFGGPPQQTAPPPPPPPPTVEAPLDTVFRWCHINFTKDQTIHPLNNFPKALFIGLFLTRPFIIIIIPC